ncbi:hypothetical protein ES705_25305 [subsurface metagenome]
MERPSTFTKQINERIDKLNKLEGDRLLNEGADLLGIVLDEIERLQQTELRIKAIMGLSTLPED